MNTLTTQNVEIQVETFFQQEYSNPLQNEFMFAYRITITNHNPFPVKLQSRHWEIYDSLNGLKTVDGDGVVGHQPVILSGDQYQYVSGANLHSEIGTMTGWYEMTNEETKRPIRVWIPCFDLVVPYKMN